MHGIGSVNYHKFVIKPITDNLNQLGTEHIFETIHQEQFLFCLLYTSSPEMRADNKIHRFTYGFTAWEGSFTDSDVVRQGYELNVKPLITAGSTKTFRAVQVEKENVILDTLKPAEDGSGDLILRLYESKKASVRTRVECGFGSFRAYLCDICLLYTSRCV